VSFGLRRVRTTFTYNFDVKVFLKSGADCLASATINDDDKEICKTSLTGEGSECAHVINLWVSDAIEGVQPCVCLILYCHVPDGE